MHDTQDKTEETLQLQFILELTSQLKNQALGTSFATCAGAGWTSYNAKGKRWPAFIMNPLKFAAIALSVCDKNGRDNERLIQLLLNANTSDYYQGVIIFWRIHIPTNHPLYSSSSKIDTWEREQY